MTAPSRIGFVTLIILVGCILAIPHFRHPTRSAEAVETDNAQTGEETALKLKVSPQERKDNAVSVARNTLREDVSLDQHSILVQTPIKSPGTSMEREEWKFPPVAEPEDDPPSNASALQPVSPNLGQLGGQPGQKRTVSSQFRPVRLLGNDIGQAQDFQAQEPQSFSREPRQSVASRFEKPRPTTHLVAGTPQNQLARRIPVGDGNRPLALHRVVNGDTLENLAQQYYRDPRQAMLIFESNRQVLLNPAILPIGIDLKIPPAGSLARQ